MIPDFVIPLAIFLIPFGLFLMMYLLYSAFNVYHLLRFGIYNAGAYVFTILFLGGTFVLLGFSLWILSPYDWAAPFNATTIFQTEAIDIFKPL